MIACMSEYFPHFIFFIFLKLSIYKTQSELPLVIQKVIEESISILAIYRDKKKDHLANSKHLPACLLKIVKVSSVSKLLYGA